jgi:hypothetical protein
MGDRSLQVLFDQRRRDAHRPETPLFERVVAVGVMRLSAMVGGSVDLHDQAARGAVEVNDVTEDHCLPPEADAELILAEPSPKQLFARRRMLPEPTRSSELPRLDAAPVARRVLVYNRRHDSTGRYEMLRRLSWIRLDCIPLVRLKFDETNASRPIGSQHWKR